MDNQEPEPAARPVPDMAAVWQAVAGREQRKKLTAFRPVVDIYRTIIACGASPEEAEHILAALLRSAGGRNGEG